MVFNYLYISNSPGYYAFLIGVWSNGKSQRKTNKIAIEENVPGRVYGLLAKSQTNRKRLKIPDFIFLLWHFFEVDFFGCAKNEGNFSTRKKIVGNGSVAMKKKTKTASEKK